MSTETLYAQLLVIIEIWVALTTLDDIFFQTIPFTLAISIIVAKFAGICVLYPEPGE